MRWDNSHQGCHIDLPEERRKVPDGKRDSLKSFEEISDSVVDDLQHIRSIVRSALDDEDFERLSFLLRSVLRI